MRLDLILVKLFPTFCFVPPLFAATRLTQNGNRSFLATKKCCFSDSNSVSVREFGGASASWFSVLCSILGKWENIYSTHLKKVNIPRATRRRTAEARQSAKVMTETACRTAARPSITCCTYVCKTRSVNR